MNTITAKNITVKIQSHAKQDKVAIQNKKQIQKQRIKI